MNYYRYHRVEANEEGSEHFQSKFFRAQHFSKNICLCLIECLIKCLICECFQNFSILIRELFQHFFNPVYLIPICQYIQKRQTLLSSFDQVLFPDYYDTQVLLLIQMNLFAAWGFEFCSKNQMELGMLHGQDAGSKIVHTNFFPSMLSVMTAPSSIPKIYGDQTCFRSRVKHHFHRIQIFIDLSQNSSIKSN